MSNFSSEHNFVPFIKGAKPLSGQRLSKVWYKGKSAGAFANVMVSVPAIDPATVTADVLLSLRPQVLAMLETEQDSIIRQMHEGGSETVTDADISVEAVIASLQAQAAGEDGRLSAESIKVWFAGSLREALVVAFGEKLGISDSPTSEQVHRIEQACNSTRDNLCRLVGKGAMPLNLVQSLGKVLELAPEDDFVAAVLTRKVDGLIAAATATVDSLML